MKKWLPSLLPILGTVLTALVPAIQHAISSFVSAHPAWLSVITSIGLVINHQLTPPGAPPSDSTIAKIGGASLLCLVLVFGLTGCSQLDTVISDLPVATDIALSAVNIYEVVEGTPQPEVEAQIKEYSGELATDLSLLNSILKDIKASPTATAYQKADAVLAAAEGHLSALLTAAHVTNPRTQAAIGAVINLVQAVLDNVAKLLPKQNAQFAPFAATLAQSPNAAPVLKPGTAAKHFNQAMKDLGVNVRVHQP